MAGRTILEDVDAGPHSPFQDRPFLYSSQPNQINIYSFYYYLNQLQPPPNTVYLMLNKNDLKRPYI